MPRASSVGLASAVALICASASPALEISFDVGSVSVSGVTPFGSCLFLSVYRYTSNWAPTAGIIAERQVDDDGDGIVSYVVERGWLPDRSIWAAVDEATSDAAFSRPRDTVVPLISLPRSALVENDHRETIAVDVLGSEVAVLLMRRGEGVWLAWIEDGGETDGDEEHNGFVRAYAQDLNSIVGSPPAPVTLERGDFVIGVDMDAVIAWWARVR